MKRLHLFEFHDQEWFPESWRNEITLILEKLWTLDLPIPFFTPPYLAVTEILERNLGKNPKIIDICSGSGGPLLKIASTLYNSTTVPVKILLTDLYPNQESIDNLSGNTLVSYHKEPVDACKIPASLFKDSKQVIRTCFGAFHHLEEHIAKRVLKDTIENSHCIIIVDLPDCSIFSVLSQCILFYVSWILYLLYIRPLTFTRFMNIIIPVIPLILTIDGILSALRTYSKEDYWRILSEIPDSFDQYSWKISKVSCFSLKNSRLKNTFIGSIMEIVLNRLFVLQVLEGIPRQSVKD